MGLEMILYGAIAGISLAAVGTATRPTVEARLLRDRSFDRELSHFDLAGATLACEVCTRGMDESSARIIKVKRHGQDPTVVCDRTECILAYTRSDGESLQRVLNTQ